MGIMVNKKIRCEEIEVRVDGYTIRGLDAETPYMTDVSAFLDTIKEQVVELKNKIKG